MNLLFRFIGCNEQMFYLSPITNTNSPITVELPFKKQNYDINQERSLLIVWSRGKPYIYLTRYFCETLMSEEAILIMTKDKCFSKEGKILSSRSHEKLVPKWKERSCIKECTCAIWKLHHHLFKVIASVKFFADNHFIIISTISITSKRFIL